MRPSFVFDQNKCTGCGACSVACTIENELPFTESWRRVLTLNPERLPGLATAHLSMACNHCAEPACMDACPAAAYSQDPATGVVLVDDAKCIGCRYCTWACPYDAPRFSEERGTVSKCTFCSSRLAEGLEPACAAYCPTDALNVTLLSDEEQTHDVVGIPETGLGPAIRIVPLRPGAEAPVGDPAATPPAAVPPFALGTPPAPTRKISFRTEWSLAAFTFLVAVLSGAMTAHRMTALHVPWPLFATLAAVALGLSAAHLGRKERAWRAVLNVRTSWLSREVIAVPAFFTLALAHLPFCPRGNPVCFSAVTLGLVALFCIDRVYDVTTSPKGARPHSAGALLTGVFLAAVFGGIAWAAVVLGAVKLGLFARRKLAAAGTATPVRPTLSAARVFLGFVAPFALWFAEGPTLRPLVLGCFLAGEFLDRAEFYMDLDVFSPQRSHREALEASLS